MLSQNNNPAVIDGVGDISLQTLKKLIISAKQGSAESFEQVYTLLYTPLYRYTISRCHDNELANDICQQTFLNFYKALASYEPEKSPLAYLFTIAKRLLINHHDKNAVVSFDESLFEMKEDESVNIIEEAHIKQLAESINGYLPKLTSDEQDVIRLYFYGELGYKEIAEILTKEEVYIRKIKERALKKLNVLTNHLYVEK
jgi:RNA polymerase sigma-70 factor (ECF subfamily)